MYLNLLVRLCTLFIYLSTGNISYTNIILVWFWSCSFGSVKDSFVPDAFFYSKNTSLFIGFMSEVNRQLTKVIRFRHFIRILNEPFAIFLKCYRTCLCSINAFGNKQQYISTEAPHREHKKASTALCKLVTSVAKLCRISVWPSTCQKQIGLVIHTRWTSAEYFERYKVFYWSIEYLSQISSASMKSYHFWNFDSLKIIKEIWTVTLHSVFLVNYRHALSNKTVLIALQLESSCYTCILCFSRFIKMWKHYFQKQTCQCTGMPGDIHWKRHRNGFDQTEQAMLRFSGTATTW